MRKSDERRVDYDDIAHLYDERRRDHPPDENLAAFLGAPGAPAGQVHVLDVGCGTGKQLAQNVRRYPGLQMTGVDRSQRMLEIARRRTAAVRWIQGDAEALPLASSSADYATNQFSYPHIHDKRAFVSEVFRVLRPGGRFVVTNIDPWAMEDWVIYRYFPESRARDDRDFLRAEQLRGMLEDSGFASVGIARFDRTESQDLREFAESAAQRHSASQLMAIPDEAYHAGLRRLQRDLESGTMPTVRSAFVILTIIADKP